MKRKSKDRPLEPEPGFEPPPPKPPKLIAVAFEGEEEDGRGERSEESCAGAPAVNDFYSVATEDDVGCPQCLERYPVTPHLHFTAAECPQCGTVFVIKPPGTPPYQPQLSQEA